MEILELKKAIFYSNRIVILKKKGNITINIEDIERIDYDKPTLWNYIVRAPALGYLRIFLKNKMLKAYYVRIKYKEVLKLPEFYRKKINSNLV